MSKTINISDTAYEWLLKKASKETINNSKNISMADVVDDLIKKD